MNPQAKNSALQLRLLLGVLFLVIMAGTIGWWLGRSKTNPISTSANTSSNAAPDSGNTATPAGTPVKALVTYSLPDGWRENACANATEKVFIIPVGASLNCDANPSAPIKITVDPQNVTDCQDLANPQNVRKHICKSMFIDGHKTLVASTEYTKSATYNTDTTISSYYINTGKGVVRVDYTYTSSNDYQMGFDQLATNMRVKK